MRAAYLLLLGLIGVSPALLVVDGPMIHALFLAYAAVAVALLGALIHPGEAEYLASIFRPIAIIAMILAFWLMIQVIPLPVKSWAHPIWADAETALGRPIAGFITIDPGATLMAICRYFAVMAILLVATAVTIDRLRAEGILFWLVGATTFAAVLHIIHGLIGFNFLDAVTNIEIAESTTALSALGVIMTAAAVVRAIERYETRRTETEAAFTKFTIALSVALVAFGICGLSLVFFSRGIVSLATVSGLASLAILVIIRRLGFGPWAGDSIAMMSIAVVIVTVLAFAEKHVGSGNTVLRYGSHSQSSLMSVTQRIVGDTGWDGTGAGTFELLLPIYGTSVKMPAPTTAAQIVIELGSPALVIILIMALGVLFMLLRGALQRGRDSFYPAAAAGCIVVLTLEAFCDASFASTTVLICAVAALGLGLAQRVGRTIQ
jgi:hypothetical protein